jgi:5'-3' exonuclease
MNILNYKVLSTYSKPGYEADDIIGTFAKNAQKDRDIMLNLFK